MTSSTDYRQEESEFAALVGDSLALIDYILVNPHMTDIAKTDCIRVLKMFIGTISPHECIADYRLAVDSVIRVIKGSLP